MSNVPYQTAITKEAVTGLVERVVCHHQTSYGFCVLLLKAADHQAPVTVIGRVSRVSPGEWLEATGRWDRNHLYGLQFIADDLRVKPPTSQGDVLRYLASPMAKGIDPKLRNQLTQSLAQQKGIRKIMTFLSDHGMGPLWAVRIYRTYGAEAGEKLRTNPYRLAHDIPEMEFRDIDWIAKRMGSAHEELNRVLGGIAYVLGKGMEKGSCGIPQNELVAEAARLLQVDKRSVSAALKTEINEGEIIEARSGHTLCAFPAFIAHAEHAIAARLLDLASSTPCWGKVDADSALSWLRAVGGFLLSKQQVDAVRQALTSKVSVITGGPGVGKSTAVRSTLTILGQMGVRVLLCAPTSQAAKRMSDATGCETQNIQQLLALDPSHGGLKHDEHNPLPCDLLVLSEASMIDVPHMHALIRALPYHASLLIVGDTDMTPSIGPGQVLADIIHSDAVPVVRMSSLFRQEQQSRIVINAHRVRQGQAPDLKCLGGRSECYFLPVNESTEAHWHVLNLVRYYLPDSFGFDPIDDIQILCPDEYANAGAKELNQTLQLNLNSAHYHVSVERFGWRFAPGDKVMQTRNDHTKCVFNGEMGRVIDVRCSEEELEVNFEGRQVTYDFGELDELVPAYATTIHKAQGSEYRAVIIPVFMEHLAMLKRSLLYTGITRGKELVILVGQEEAVKLATQLSAEQNRWTRLQDCLTPHRK
ncbi:AAA family ATPase [Halorhodospira halochloris]|uniref:SF1B family DNA helicase RecD2 n=1 Tax=Halorhodospira halochloris TaxID=1052 RepID=UPI001EE8AF8D|nr:AAA family ATPase [Halorhodospira halochloris]MCG5547538.1 ATP-dependent RecD-like DNA helicase [Halorhodospira halochloris]